MSESFSVIIPARNAGQTLRACLEAVFASDVVPDEVLVVNDTSADKTLEIANDFPCRVLEVKLQSGPMEPRFAGARAAQGRFLIFVDADVCVAPGSFRMMLERLRPSDGVAVTGALRRSSRIPGFFSAYKNEYMNYIFSSQPRKSQFLYGSIWGIRKNAMIYFDTLKSPFGSLVSDSEMGIRLNRAGKVVVLELGLEVEHLKEYSGLRLIKNDFVIPFMFARMLVSYWDPKRIREHGAFSHASVWQVSGNLLAFFALGLMVVGGIAKNPSFFLGGVCFLIPVFIIWLPFVKRIAERGRLFAVQALCFLPIDCAIMFLGMVSGFIYSLCRVRVGKGAES
ncbi:MAG: glycosyltransferase family 2 protein [Candidatus Omnitrophota bacterium]|nr:glycosyltransferase family 2 protein [Candidatus Omnitrophota bacterium]